MNVFQKEDIDLLLNHPDISSTQVLAELIGESKHLMYVWKKNGISQKGLDKINRCDHLTNLDLSKQKDIDIDVAAVCSDFVDSIDEKPLIKSLFKSQDLANWRRRHKVPTKQAVIINQIFGVKFSDMRPDKPDLYWPPMIDKYKSEIKTQED